VTGGTSGIGKSLVQALARQGLNVVVLGLEMRDGELDGLHAELTAAHPGVEFRVKSVDFSAAAPDAYLAATRAVTDDIDVQVVFLNAGYMVTGLFDSVPLPRWLANVHCNATSAIAMAHHFIGRLRASRLRGCVVFTSSPANIIPSPFSVTYGATKSFITHLATSLACEAGPEGIDVSVVHPSPTATRFYDGAHAMPTLKMFQATAIGPDAVADVAIRGVGRSVIIDQGYYPLVMRLLIRLVDLVFLSDLLVMLAPYVQDYKYLKAQPPPASAPAPAPVPAPTPVTADATSLDAGKGAASARKRARSPAAKKAT